jgi:hypothetical protein
MFTAVNPNQTIFLAFMVSLCQHSAQASHCLMNHISYLMPQPSHTSRTSLRLSRCSAQAHAAWLTLNAESPLIDCARTHTRPVIPARSKLPSQDDTTNAPRSSVLLYGLFLGKHQPTVVNRASDIRLPMTCRWAARIVVNIQSKPSAASTTSRAFETLRVEQSPSL